MLVNGKQIANRIKDEIREILKTSGKKSLVIFYVGENPVIDSYVALKKRFGEEVGVSVDIKKFPETISEDELAREITGVLPEYSGAIVQLPLPVHISKERILDLVPIEKDVDVLSSASFEAFSKGETAKLPPVVASISEIVSEYHIDLQNKKVVVVGNGALVGKPVSAWLKRQNILHTILDSMSENSETLLQDADVIISGVGVPGLIKQSMIKEGSVLFDAGASTSSGRLAGDIDPACYGKAALVSPVPGGIGPITVASLFKNIFLK